MDKARCLPHISVDCVIFLFEDGKLKVLVRKEYIPLDDGSEDVRYKFPGNHMYYDEQPEHTAARILSEQTGAQHIFMSQFNVFCALDRISRDANEYAWIKREGLIEDRIITIGFYSLIKPHQRKKLMLNDRAEWVDANSNIRLIFDHQEILDSALEQLRIDMMLQPIIFELLPQKFTLGQLQNIYEIILDRQFDKRNFRRKVGTLKYLIACDEKQVGVAHKPAQLFRFDRKVYNKLKKEHFESIL